MAKPLKPARQLLGRRSRSAGTEIVKSGFLVPAYYAAQAGTKFESDPDAADHYLDEGWSRGLLPNPVHDFTGLEPPGPEAVASHDFASTSAALPVRRYVDVQTYRQLVPEASRHPGGPAGHLLETLAGPGLDIVMAEPGGRSFTWKELLDLTRARGRSLAKILSSGLFDQELYETQAGLAFASDAAAVWHYLEIGADAGWTPNLDFRARLNPPRPKAPKTSVFARAIMQDDVQIASPQTQGELRTAVLEQAARGRAAAALGPSATATIPHDLGTFAAQKAARRSDLTVTIVAHASRLERFSDQHALTIVSQTHTAWEMLVAIDEDTTGYRRDRAERLAASDDRISTIDVSSGAANIATYLAAGSGDVIAFWDGNERWAPRFLELSLLALKDHLVVASATVWDTDVDQPDPHARADLAVGTVEQLAWSGPRGLHGVLAQRSAFDSGPDPTTGLAGQWDWLLSARQRAEIGFIPMIGVAGTSDQTVDPGVVADIRARWVPVRRNERSAGTSAALMPVIGDAGLAIDTIELAAAAGLDIVVVLDDSRAAVEIASVLPATPHLRLIVLPDSTTWGHAASIAVAATTAETVIFLSGGTTFRPEDIARMTAELGDDVVAVVPAVISADSTIRSAGLVLPGRRHLPYRLFHGHPAEDMHLLEGADFAAGEGEGLTMRTATIDEFGMPPGLDEAWAAVALTSRAVHAGGRVRTIADARFEVRRTPPVVLDPTTAPDEIRFSTPAPAAGPPLDATGLELVGLGSDAERRVAPILLRPPRLVPDGDAAGLPALRWALKVPMKSNTRGDSAGDVFFSNDLAAALRRLGQEVVQDRRDSHHRPTSSHLDEVVLAIRGLIAYEPQPDVTSALWVISHPDEVEPDEVGPAVDLVYAASDVWSERASRRFAREVRPLLQATEPRRFHPDVTPSPHDILFVGRPRKGSSRPIVRDALLAGQHLDVYGPRWATVLDPSHIRGDFLPNKDVPGAYAGARIVLNDHHADMAANGFWSNRAFDAVSSGALVVSDEVAGGADLFGGLVRSYTSVEELGELLALDAPGWPDLEVRQLQAERIRHEHSFDARARTLLADVLDVRNVAHELRA